MVHSITSATQQTHARKIKPNVTFGFSWDIFLNHMSKVFLRDSFCPCEKGGSGPKGGGGGGKDGGGGKPLRSYAL